MQQKLQGKELLNCLKNSLAIKMPTFGSMERKVTFGIFENEIKKLHKLNSATLVVT
jgi:hypothetical protein